MASFSSGVEEESLLELVSEESDESGEEEDSAEEEEVLEDEEELLVLSSGLVTVSVFFPVVLGDAVGLAVVVVSFTSVVGERVEGAVVLEESCAQEFRDVAKKGTAARMSVSLRMFLFIMISPCRDYRLPSPSRTTKRPPIVILKPLFVFCKRIIK